MDLLKLLAIILWAGSAQAAEKAVAEYDFGDPEVIAERFNQARALARKQKNDQAVAIYAELIRETKTRGFDQPRQLACKLLFRLVYRSIEEEEVAALFDECPNDQRQILLGLVDREPIPVYGSELAVGSKYLGQRLEYFEACVLVEYAISANGRPQQIEIILTSYPRLIPPIKRAIKHRRFAPALKDGVKVAVEGYRTAYFVSVTRTPYRFYAVPHTRTIDLGVTDQTGDCRKERPFKPLDSKNPIPYVPE